MAKVWKKLQRADSDFTGNVTGQVDGTAVGTIKSGAAAGATANQDSTATILGGTFTGNIGGTSAADIKTGADRARRKINTISIDSSESLPCRRSE